MFRGHLKRKSESIVRDNEHGDLFYFAGRERYPHYPQLTQKKKTRERFGKNEGEWTGKVEISSRKKSLAVGEKSVQGCNLA